MDTKVILVICAALFILIVLSFLFRFVLLYQKKSLSFKVEKEIMQTQFQQELLRTQLEIQEQTFKIISQEIHDNIGQMLSLAKLNLNTLDFSKGEAAAEKIKDAKELVSKAIQDLRDLSKTLNTETITTVGLVRSIEQELNLLQKTGAIETQFDVKGTPVKTDAQKELILFRIVQEALHNVIKHAAATVIAVSVIYDEVLEVIIEDNGTGFDSGKENIFGSGLRNMQSRSLLIGASLKIASSSENGTKISIRLPLTV